MTTPKRLGWDPLLLDEYVEQRLHRLHLLIRNQFVVFGDGDKVDEAHVEDVMLVDVPEWVKPMRMVEVGIATEHLLHNALAILVECLGETTRLADPFLRLGVCAGVGWSKPGGLIDGKGFRRVAHDPLSREHDWVVDLADNPFLNAVDEFGSRYLGCTTVHKPSVGQARFVSGLDRSILGRHKLTVPPTSLGRYFHCK